FPKPETSTITLPSKPTARLGYTYYAPSSISSPAHPNLFAQTLVIFLNGLGLPRSSWTSAITHFLCERASLHLPYPALLTYDRYGQGDSDQDPDDPEPPPCHGHDAISAVDALHELVLELWDTKKHECVDPSLQPTMSALPALIFVGNSLGCALARLFAQRHPGTVSGLLFLDSIMANSDFVSLWPDPDIPGFDPKSLPAGVSMDDVRKTREEYRKRFHPDVPTFEGLSRKNLRELLPLAHGPKLPPGPYLTVVGHDWLTFAQQCQDGPMHTPQPLVMAYLNPTWTRYNEGLVKITDEDRAIGPIIAVGCGHFIQKDGPQFVAEELAGLLDRVVNRVEQLMDR
ncbi:uncharacterized protein EI97DRAFT_353650, partial [Westerdykella ornata]